MRLKDEFAKYAKPFVTLIPTPRFCLWDYWVGRKGSGHHVEIKFRNTLYRRIQGEPFLTFDPWVDPRKSDLTCERLDVIWVKQDDFLEIIALRDGASLIQSLPYEKATDFERPQNYDPVVAIPRGKLLYGPSSVLGMFE